MAPFSQVMEPPQFPGRFKLLPTYLATRKGNCVSMPILFVILGQKLGVDLTLSTAPEHLFVKYRGDDGKYYNFEATSGGPILDSSLQKYYPMSDKALANGIYMQPLSKREAVIAMTDTLAQLYREQGQDERQIALGKFALRYYPKYISGVLRIAAGYHHQIEQEYMRPYPNPKDIPEDLRPRFIELSKNDDLWWGRAEALGWQMPSEATKAKYLKTVKQAKSARQMGE